MFVGASLGGTGGGIKTLTAVVILLAIYSYIKGRGEVVVFERSIPPRVVYKAMVILSLSLAYTTATVGLSVGNLRVGVRAYAVNELHGRFLERLGIKGVYEVAVPPSMHGKSLRTHRPASTLVQSGKVSNPKNRHMGRKSSCT